MASVTAQYIELVQRFVSGEIDAEQFADQAIDFWSEEFERLQEDSHENRIIAELCLEADALTNDPPYDTSAEELHEAARKALSELLELQMEGNKPR